MQLCIDLQGRVRFVYTEALDLTSLGPPTIRRASSVEPDARGHWHADLGPVGGPVLGPFCGERCAACGTVLAGRTLARARGGWLNSTRCPW